MVILRLDLTCDKWESSKGTINFFYLDNSSNPVHSLSSANEHYRGKKQGKYCEIIFDFFGRNLQARAEKEENVDPLCLHSNEFHIVLILPFVESFLWSWETIESWWLFTLSDALPWKGVGTEWNEKIWKKYFAKMKELSKNIVAVSFFCLWIMFKGPWHTLMSNLQVLRLT